jgi:hypothetical protein
MALSNLRTGITVRQERSTASPNVQSTTLPVVLVGVNRDLKYQAKADIFDWSAGTAASGVEFPGFASGIVEDGTANPALKPRFFVSNTLGQAEITDSVTLGNLDGSLGAPTFNIPSGLAATFAIASGVSGSFTLNTASGINTDEDDTFRDLSADFVFDQVRAGDSIMVNGVEEYAITGVTQDTELAVRRVGKGPESAGVAEAAKLQLSAENTEDLRTLTTTSQAFIDAGGFGPDGTRVKGGDLLTVDNWSQKFNSGGLTFGFAGEDDTVPAGADRSVALSGGSFGVTPLPYDQEVLDNADAGSVWFILTDDGMAPAFYTISGTTSSANVADFATSAVSPSADADDGRAFELFTYTALFLDSRGVGGFSAQDANGERTFTFQADLSPSKGSNSDATIHILIKDTDGVYRPAFVGSSASLDGTATTVAVTDVVGGNLVSSSRANNVEYVIVEAVSQETGGTATVGAVVSGVREVDLGSATLNTGLAEGDLVFSDSGTLMFEVATAAISGVSVFGVRDTAGAGVGLTDAATLAQFGFTIRTADQPSKFVVRRVISNSELEVKQATEALNSIPDDERVYGFVAKQDTANFAVDPKFASVTVGDSAAGIAYSVDKTVSGANLTGDVLVSYAAVRDDLVGLQEITADNYASVLGDDSVDNPLGLAGRVYFGNSSANLYVVQVAADTTEGWLAAIEATKTDTVYNIVPLTQEETYLTLFQASTVEQSTADNKRERILWQSKAFPQNAVLASWLDSDNATVSRTAAGAQTVYIERDLLALSVAIGDDFSGSWFNGTQTVAFGGRILDIEVIGSTTTLTILPDGNVPPSISNMVVSAYEIKDRPKSLAERRVEVANYPTTIADRRIRNIFPDQVVMQFSDNSGNGQSTGFYGGGVQTATTGAYYMCVVEAAKRTVFGAAKPLTKRGGSGIYQVLDSFAEAPGFQDTIVDAGNYYMEQPGGVGAAVQTIRALTTDVSELITAEESVTPQIDSFTRRLRAQLTPLLGPEILDQRFFDLVSTVAQSAVTRTLNEKQLKSIKLLEITESPDTADTFLMKYEVAPYFSGARGIITLFF